MRIVASEDVGPADSMVAVQVRALYENWVEARKGRPKDQQFAAGERPFLVHAVIVLARAHKSRTVDHALMVMYEGDRKRLEIPDYALDKHTLRGKRMGRGHEHFFTEGARIVGETIPDPYLDEGQQVRGRGRKSL
jgi:replication-associated recombination protein RarA